MSEYFQVLKRIQSEQGQPAPQALEDCAPRPRAVQRPPVAPVVEPLKREREKTSFEFAPSRFGVLFENIRALSDGRPTTAIVFASAAAEPVRPITGGLAAHARQLGLNATIAELTAAGARRSLRPACDGSTLIHQPTQEWPIDLGGRSTAGGVTDWLRSAASAADLVLIEGPALESSIDSALLARACDGLIIVVHAEVTRKEALAVAVERTRTVGCHILGLVIHGGADPLPQWIGRWLGKETQSIPSFQDPQT